MKLIIEEITEGTITYLPAIFIIALFGTILTTLTLF